jgi:trehalose-6-phosphatase
MTASLGDVDGLHVRFQKDVVELAVLPVTSSWALDALRASTNATAVLYLGDDDTDEDAFATLDGDDVGVKVGAGRTLAQVRIPSARDAVALLARVAQVRALQRVGT